jgi:sialate O-acetylesterase
MSRYFQYIFALFFYVLLLSCKPSSSIKLPSIFGNNMVLQQQTNAAIWGKSNPYATIKISTTWSTKTYTLKANAEGKWKVKISTPKAGGPYEITISDGNAIILKNVLIGEVWVCTGQSNMEMPMEGFYKQPILGADKAIALSNNPNIHFFTVGYNVSLDPLDDFDGEWQVSSPEKTKKFSATAYYFGKMLNKKLNIPIGLINASSGGTKIETWYNLSGFKKFVGDTNFQTKSVKNLFGQEYNRLSSGMIKPLETPTVLFNALINPMVGYSIKGMICYQGEANCREPQKYQKLLTGLIQNWRSTWEIGDFPFYFAQIAPYNNHSYGLNSAFLREAQLKSSDILQNTGMVSLMDIGEKNIIHPANKEIGGNRLAFLALNKTYGFKEFFCQSPTLKEMKIIDSLVVLTFDNAPNGLTSYGKTLSNFEIAGNNKKFYPATAVINSNKIYLKNSSVEIPFSVRYAFKDFAIGDLFSVEGLPVSSFRTDDWEN